MLSFLLLQLLVMVVFLVVLLVAVVIGSSKDLVRCVDSSVRYAPEAKMTRCPFFVSAATTEYRTFLLLSLLLSLDRNIPGSTTVLLSTA